MTHRAPAHTPHPHTPRGAHTEHEQVLQYYAAHAMLEAMAAGGDGASDAAAEAVARELLQGDAEAWDATLAAALEAERCSAGALLAAFQASSRVL